MTTESMLAEEAERDALNTPPAIRALWVAQGGRNGGLMAGIDGGPDYWLIYAADASATGDFEWGSYGKDEPGAKSDRDGLANTLALASSANDHPAAEFAVKCRLGGHADWYIPSTRELRLLAANAPGDFEPVWHWSSTQSSRNHAWMQTFDDGFQDFGVKLYSRRVRLVRRFVL